MNSDYTAWDYKTDAAEERIVRIKTPYSTSTLCNPAFWHRSSARQKIGSLSWSGSQSLYGWHAHIHKLSLCIKAISLKQPQSDSTEHGWLSSNLNVLCSFSIWEKYGYYWMLHSLLNQWCQISIQTNFRFVSVMDNGDRQAIKTTTGLLLSKASRALRLVSVKLRTVGWRWGNGILRAKPSHTQGTLRTMKGFKRLYIKNFENFHFDPQRLSWNSCGTPPGFHGYNLMPQSKMRRQILTAWQILTSPHSKS